MTKYIIIILIIVFNIIACGIEYEAQDTSGHLNDCPECKLIAPDTSDNPVNVVGE